MSKSKDDGATPADEPRPYQVGYRRPPIEHRFKPGHSGNQAGRPRGSRNRINERFLAALCEDFEEHGPRVIERVRRYHPAVYLRVIARLVPTHVLVQESPLEELSDDELATYLAAVRRALGFRESDVRGDETEEGGDQALPLLPVPETKAVP